VSYAHGRVRVWFKKPGRRVRIWLRLLHPVASHTVIIILRNTTGKRRTLRMTL
jgi:hypothetical protein